ncbi:MAG: hypothetical protein ACE5NP_08860 [Anaerolineae bacterium]
MLDYCPFLKSERRGEWGPPYCCRVGVNFYSVGKERELCRTCPLAHLGQALPCEHLDVYTFLQRDEEMKQLIKVEMECLLEERKLADLRRCDHCPDFQGARK